MPLYEYKCESCAHQFEEIVPHAQADVEPPCPQCGGGKCPKLISRTSFSLKGGGWADDGYATSPRTESEK